MSKTERVNIRVSNEVKDWYVALSEKTGISMSSLMAVALSEYIDQKKSIQAMGTLNQMYTELSGLDVLEKADFMKKKLKDIDL